MPARKRGLGSASKETVSRVATKGGRAPHNSRGLQSADRATRSKVARLGGLARQAQRSRTKNRGLSRS